MLSGTGVMYLTGAGSSGSWMLSGHRRDVPDGSWHQRQLVLERGMRWYPPEFIRV